MYEPEDLTTIEFVNRIYSMTSISLKDVITDEIYNTLFDKVVKEPDWTNEVLQILDVEKLPSYAIRSILVVTRLSNKKLTERERFFKNALNRVTDLLGKDIAEKSLLPLKN